MCILYIPVFSYPKISLLVKEFIHWSITEEARFGDLQGDSSVIVAVSLCKSVANHGHIQPHICAA